MNRLACCVDFGSTFTKGALVDLETGSLMATAAHPTTLGTDVLDGWQECLADLAGVDDRATSAPVLACSSAGGGLRVAVVGNEELVTAEAGRRVALSSGGRVVHVAFGELDATAVKMLRESRPDVLLLVGGTDGGNAEVLVACAAALMRADWAGPVVVAGNVAARPEVEELLSVHHTPYVLADNVVPQIGVLRPEPARAAIREMFLRHVIGGKHLSRRSDFVAMVRGATPDVVLTAVELLAQGLGERSRNAGDVVVVDIGGATTDVHSVVQLDPEDSGLARQVVATVPVSRTVEADLGMRWSAVSTVEAGVTAGLVEGGELAAMTAAAELRREHPAFVPGSDAERTFDGRLAAVAVGVALRRHSGRQQVAFGSDGRVVERSGKDLRAVGLVVGSGGVLRHNGAEFARRALKAGLGNDETGGWMLPSNPRVVVDDHYVLAAAGLLAEEHPHAAQALLAGLAGR